MKQQAVAENEVVSVFVVDGFGRETIRERDPAFFLCLRGNCKVKLESGTWEMRENDYFVLNSEEPLELEILSNPLIVKVNLKYSSVKDYLDLVTNRIACSSFETSPGAARIREQLRRVVSLVFSADLKDPVRLLSDCYQLLFLIHQYALVRRRFSEASSNVDDEERLLRIEGYINTHYNHAITLQDLADETYLTPAYLSKYIKRKFGRNLTDILLDLRLEHALRDVQDTGFTFTRIALNHGFSNVSVFNRAFRTKYGTSPSVWRKQHQNTDQGAPEDRNESLLDSFYEYFNTNPADISDDPDTSVLFVSTVEPKSFKRFWSMMINAGPAHHLLRADMQEHILLLKKELGFEYVRFWDIYAPEMMIWDGNRNHRYNFSRLDSVIDFLHDNKLHPYIELGFKPVLLLREIKDYLRREERESIFENAQDYGVFLEQFFRHYIGRYGLETVSQWYFEQWKDPRFSSFGEYLDYFEMLYTRAKDFSPDIHIGGAGFGNESNLTLEEDIREWSKRYSQPDFVSFYAYPYVSGEEEGRASDAGGRILSEDENFVRNYLERIQKTLHDNEFWYHEVHLSEWNFTVTNRNGLNDSIFKGAYIVKNLIDMQGRVDWAGYWFGSDLFSEFYDTSHLIDGSGGLISKDGIKKPAFYAFSFFSGLDSYLLGKDENSIITTDMHDGYSIVCHNFRPPNSGYFRKNGTNVSVREEEKYYDSESKQLGFRIRGVKNGRYQVKSQVVNHEYGSVLDEWKRMDFTDNLTARDISYLRAISVPRVFIRTIDVTDGVLEFTVTLPANAIENIRISYIL